MQPASAGVGRAAFTACLALAAGIGLTFLAMPIVALFTEVPLSRVPDLLRDPAVRDAIAVTIRTNAVANFLIVFVGTPVAYLLATRAFPGRSIAITLVELPLVMPPAVAGIALLAAFGAGGLLGDDARRRGDRAAVHRVGGRAGRRRSWRRRSTCARRSPSFEGVDPMLRRRGAHARRLARARTFARIALPLARRGAARGLGARVRSRRRRVRRDDHLRRQRPGETQTLTLAIYEQLDVELRRRAGDRDPARRAQRDRPASYKLLSSWTPLELDIAVALRVVRARRPSDGRRGDGRARRPVGRRQDDRAARGRRPARGRTAGGSRSATTCGSTARRGVDPPARARARSGSCSRSTRSSRT